MQGEQHWELFWETVTDFAEKFDLQSVRLNVNLPVLHEEYHASLVRKPRQDDRLMWSSEFPLRAHGLCVGSLTLTGIAAHDFVSDRMATLFGGLQQVERHLHELLEDAAAEMTLRATVAELTVLSKLSDHTAASRPAPVVSIVGGE